MNFEQLLILHCSPTLARIKTGNLFTIRTKNEAELMQHLKHWHKKLKPKGIDITVLKLHNHLALIYVYRKQSLLQDLAQTEARAVLQEYGYSAQSLQTENLQEVLARLRHRLAEYDEFPHEIGLFLSYPIEDVCGFICHKGKNCNLCGYWKVYGDTDQAMRRFAQFDKCHSIYQKLWREGRDIMQLTVA